MLLIKLYKPSKERYHQLHLIIEASSALYAYHNYIDNLERVDSRELTVAEATKLSWRRPRQNISILMWKIFGLRNA